MEQFMSSGLFDLLVIFLGVVVTLVISYAGLRFAQSEWAQKHLTEIHLVDDFITKVVIQISSAGPNAIDWDMYKQKSDDWFADKGFRIDYRMFAALDRVEAFLKRYNISIEFDLLIPRIEAIYQQVRHADNGLVMNPEKDLANAVQGTLESYQPPSQNIIVVHTNGDAPTTPAEAQAVIEKATRKPRTRPE